MEQNVWGLGIALDRELFRQWNVVVREAMEGAVKELEETILRLMWRSEQMIWMEEGLLGL